MYDTTVRNLADLGGAFPLAGLAEPRIEPEIVFGLARAPAQGMDDAALIGCVEWVAHGFELVQSIFPNWKFSPADTVAANGLHGALLIGPRHPVGARCRGMAAHPHRVRHRPAMQRRSRWTAAAPAT